VKLACGLSVENINREFDPDASHDIDSEGKHIRFLKT
jgi:hypothetical protein